MCQLGPPWGHPWGWAEVGGPCWAPGASNQRKSLAVPSCGLVTPGSRGGFLYFISVMFPEPGSSMYHLETAIKNKPLAVFFFRTLCVQGRVREHLSFPCCQCCPPLGPVVGSCSMPLGQVWLSHPLAALRPATAGCRNDPSGSSGTHSMAPRIGGAASLRWWSRRPHHQLHGLLGFVAVGLADDVHSPLVCDILQALPVHGHQLLPSLGPRKEGQCDV